MKTLYLVRHAKSSWDNMYLADHDRPLNNRGKKNAPEMGKRLKSKNILPDLLISSSAKRAFTTAKKISQEIFYSTDDIQSTKYLYHAFEDDILSLVKRQDNDLQSLMLFGHNPGFTECANQLANTDIDNIPTCGIVAITFDVTTWDEIEFGKGELGWFDYPKKAQD